MTMQSNDNPFPRRDFLHIGGLAAFGLGMTASFAEQETAAEDIVGKQETNANTKFRKELAAEGFDVFLQDQRAGLIKQLIAVVADDKVRMSHRLRAVRILGNLRAAEAAPTLVANIETIHPELIDRKNISTVFPCVPALVSIGKPGAKEALSQLHKPMKNYIRLALAAVVGSVEGRKVGTFLVDDRIRSEKSDEGKKNLRAAREMLVGITAGID